MVISTSSPVIDPSPPVLVWIRFTTVFWTKKFPFSTLGVKVSVLRFASRVAEPISTSAGELTRLGTLPEGGKAESWGKMWYNSTSTLLIFCNSVPAGEQPGDRGPSDRCGLFELEVI